MSDEKPVKRQRNEKGHFVPGNTLGVNWSRGHADPVGLSFREKVERVLVEEWSMGRLRKLAKNDPAEFKRLLELARKSDVEAGEKPAAAGAEPVADEGTRAATDALERWLDAYDGGLGS